jgi:hypothetical protein
MKLRHDAANVKPIMNHDLLHSVKRNESKTHCQLPWRLVDCPCSVLSMTEPEASPLLRDLRVDLPPKVNHPNIPGQAHVKFADGDEHVIPFPSLQSQSNTGQMSLGSIFRKRSLQLFEGMNDHHFLRGGKNIMK